MHTLLSRLLQKQNIPDIQKLESEERAVYDRWQAILSEGDITLQKIEEFCVNQIRLIETQWSNLDNSSLKNERLLIQHTVYRHIYELLTKPKAEKESLERYLHQLLQQ